MPCRLPQIGLTVIKLIEMSKEDLFVNVLMYDVMNTLLLAYAGLFVLCHAFLPSISVTRRGVTSRAHGRPSSLGSITRIISPLEQTFGSTSEGGEGLGSKITALKANKTQDLAKKEENKRSVTQSIESNPDGNGSALNLALTPAQSRLVLVCIAAAYGTNYAAVKGLSDALDPAWASLLRFSLSAAVFAPTVWRYRGEEKGILKSGALIGILNGIGYYGQSFALNEGVSASTVAFICSLAVVVVPILNALYPDEETKAKTQGSMVMTFVPSVISALGVYFLTGVEATYTGDGGTAYVAALLQPILFGTAYWLQPKLLQKCSEPGHYLAFTGSSLAAVTLGCSLWAVYSPGVSIGQLQSHPYTLLAILWTGLATTAGTSLLENVAMKQLTGTESTVIYSSEPLWGTFFGYTLLHEAVGRSTAIGAILILSAIFLSTTEQKFN